MNQMLNVSCFRMVMVPMSQVQLRGECSRGKTELTKCFPFRECQHLYLHVHACYNTLTANLGPVVSTRININLGLNSKQGLNNTGPKALGKVILT